MFTASLLADNAALDHESGAGWRMNACVNFTSRPWLLAMPKAFVVDAGGGLQVSLGLPQKIITGVSRGLEIINIREQSIWGK
jgi:hypothetical protein